MKVNLASATGNSQRCLELDQIARKRVRHQQQPLPETELVPCGRVN